MRPRIALVLCSAFVSMFAAARGASATDCSGVVSPCINGDALWPHAGASDFESIGGTRTVAPRQMAFGLVTSYLSRPIVFEVPSPGNGSKQFAIDDQVNGTFVWAYGVAPRLELDFALPVTFGQGGAGLAPVTGGSGINDTAVRDARFGFSYALVPNLPAPPDPDVSRLRGGLALRLEMSAPTGDRDQFAGERSGVFVPSASGDVRIGPWFAGAELGARIRPTTELLGSRVGTQLVAALGVGVQVLPRELLNVTAEAWALPTFVRQYDLTQLPSGPIVNGSPNDTVLAPAEWQVSVRSAPVASGALAFQLGGGGALPFSGTPPITTPRFRFVLGIRWAPVASPSPPNRAPAPMLSFAAGAP